MMKTFVRENVPLSRFGVLVAQLESIVASSAQQPPEPLLCFDLLSDLISAIDEEPKESILLWQRKCEEALYSLLILGARRPVLHLASVVMARIIFKGDTISVYSRASSLQGFLSDGKRSEPHKIAGIAQCLGELYQHFGRRITSGLLETTIIAGKLIKFNEDFVRQEAQRLLQNALEGCGGTAAAAAYTEAFRLITRVGIGDKSFIVRIAAARCLKAFANIGGPGLGVGELDNSASYCVKVFIYCVVDGVTYFLGRDDNKYRMTIYALDVDTESFEVVAVLDVGARPGRAFLQLFNGTVYAKFFMHESSQVQIWKMQAKDSWIKEFTVCGDFSHKSFELLKISDEKIFVQLSEDLFWLNKSAGLVFEMSTVGMVNKIKTLNIPSHGREFYNVCTCLIETLHFGSLPLILAGDEPVIPHLTCLLKD